MMRTEVNLDGLPRRVTGQKCVLPDLETMQVLVAGMTGSQEVGERKEEELAAAAAMDLREGRRCEVERGRRCKLSSGSFSWCQTRQSEVECSDWGHV